MAPCVLLVFRVRPALLLAPSDPCLACGAGPRSSLGQAQYTMSTQMLWALIWGGMLAVITPL